MTETKHPADFRRGVVFNYWNYLFSELNVEIAITEYAGT